MGLFNYRLNNLKKRLIFFNEFNLLFLLIICIFSMSFLGQLSAFNGNFCAQVKHHVMCLLIGIAVVFAVYAVNFNTWNNIAYIVYIFSFCSLIAVASIGITKLGAQRWIDLYFITFQPSEIMKVALIIALARYYSFLSSSSEVKKIHNHLIPLLLTIAPAILVLKQPDLGTAIILMAIGSGIIFLSGFPIKTFIISVVIILAGCPFLCLFLHDYQKNRILTFLNPERDPFGAGYHVLQSKIAIGSGYLYGKGFLQGTQSKLNFLPEKHTDFIFTTIAEEFGFVGAVAIILLFFALTCYFFWIGSETKVIFAKLVCFGFGMLLFMHVFINIAMVMGIIPVVGIPLPFLSHGGSVMTTFCTGCGLIMAALRVKRWF